ANWVWEKLHVPRVFGYERVETRMPQFDFTDEEALSILIFLKGQTGETPPPEYRAGMDPLHAAVFKGERLVFWNGCRNCHAVGNLRPGQDPGSAAPNLLLAKERLRPDWIVPWLKNPQALLDGTRMPSFWDFSDEAHPTSPSKLFNGDAKLQIDALRDYLMHLELKPTTSSKTASVTSNRG